VNHLAEQKHALTRVFLNGFVADFNGIFNTIAKTKMPGDEKFNRPKI
jgi:hypothetical protein